jgi:YfiR/HmsC-like
MNMFGTIAWLLPRRQLRQQSWFWRLLGLGLLCLLFEPSARSQALTEYQLKAAFLYNFAAFTEWPPQVGSVLTLCIYGRDPFGAEIDELNGKATGTRTLTIQRKSNPAALQGCQILFIPSADIGQLPHLLDSLRGLPVLVVADSPGAAHLGATLNMKLVQGRMTFEANLIAARSAGLKLSARMLTLATEVIQ